MDGSDNALTMLRRDALKRLALLGAVAIGVRPRLAAAQGTQPATDTSMFGPMSENSYKPVKLAPKPGVKPVLTEEEGNEVERHLKCQCGCPLDVYTCRTTDFSCSVSPAMHADVVALVEGGYGSQEILNAFEKVYGEIALTTPKPVGFNRLAYIAPFAALGGGAAVALVLIRHWVRSRPAPVPGGTATPGSASAAASPAEMERLRAAMRDDDA